MTQSEKRLYLIKALISESPQYHGLSVPEDEPEQKRLLRSLFNVRMPQKAGEGFLQIQNEYLREVIIEKGITSINDLTPIEDRIYLWRGDITTLKCGAIVNAANSGMTGCYVPCHNCIDNCIHTFSGIQLRYECDRIIQEQGYEEPTGQAKITPSYNLPCDYVIHTVGPIVRGTLTDDDCLLLESSYRSCLKIAVENRVESIAFCCISTGVFGFPQKEAAAIAVRTVRDFQQLHNIKVIFNVFKEDDYAIYHRLLCKS